MKTKYSLLTGLAVFAACAAFGQVEHDDMYFNSKDRANLNASKEVVLAKQYKQEDLQAAKTSPINPTDSYSGRSVNPEYTNRLKTNPNFANTDSQYFVSGYQPVSVNQNLASNNCGCTSNYNNFNSPYYNGYSSYGMNQGFGSPYSSFYSPWGMSSGYQSFQPGWSSMLGYSFGSMNSGWFGGMNYGYGNSWGSPWSNYGYGGGYFPYDSHSYGMSYGGYSSNYYGTPVVINNNIDSRNTTVYSKRANRSSDTDNLIDHTRPETGYTRTGREVATGRSRSGSQSQYSESQSQYYDRGWKRDPEKNPSRSFWSDTSNSGSRSQSSWSNNTWGNSTSSGRQSSSDWGNSSSNSSRSSVSSSDGGSRSMSSGSSSSGASSSGSHSRGRD